MLRLGVLSIFFWFVLTAITACGPKDIDKIGDAQICLNNASGEAEIRECLDLVEGIESAAAYNIRCAGMFIIEGFVDPNKYISAFEAIETVSGSAMATFLSLLTFDSTNSAETTFNYCLKSGAKGSTLISAFAYLGTALLNYAPATSCSTVKGSACSDQEEVTYNIAQAASDNGLKGSIGATVQATHGISCVSGHNANNTLCDLLARGINESNGTNVSVGEKFLNALANP